MINTQKTTYHHHPGIYSPPHTKQLDLDFKPASKNYIKEKFKLSKNQMKIMQILYLNERAFTPSDLKKLSGIGGINCVNRFVVRAKTNGWITELKRIKGATVNTMFQYCKFPDKLENGQEIKDRRFKYFVITDLGKKVFEVNDENN